MYSKLYVYGDSFVHGDTLNQELTWANKLGNEFGWEVHNRGVAGGSNKLSVINLLVDLSKIENLDDTLIIFAWTSIHRTCVYIEDNKAWYNVLVTYQNKIKKFKQVEEAYFKFLHTDFDGLYNIYMQKILVQSFLKQKNANYLFINSFTDDKLGLPELDEPNLLEQFIEKDKYILGYTNSIRNEICFKYGLIGDDGFHPSEAGHDLALQIIKNDLERLL